MPQLPSGRRIGLSADRVFETLEGSDFKAALKLQQQLQEPADLLPLVDLIEYRPAPGVAEPGEPHDTGLQVADLDTERCDWPATDQQALLEWLFSEPAEEWLEERYDELTAMFEDSPPQ